MSKNINKKNSLGRGLDALITPTLSDVDVQGSSSFNEINLEDIIPNPEQPREEFDPEALEELAQSIRHLGIIQPITVHALSDNIGSFQYTRLYTCPPPGMMLNSTAFVELG